MKRRQWLIVIGGLVAVGLLISVVLAGPLDGFDLGWYLIGAGGGHASSADYGLDGSAGQPATGGLSSEDYRLGAGFWPGTGAEPSSPTPTGSPSPTVTPTGSPSPTATPTGSPSPTPTPSATPTPTPTPPPACQELLVNGDFETGSLSPWGSWGDVGVGSGHDSAYGASLGATNNAEGELLQGVTIPSAASSIDLAFWWLAESASEQPGDVVDVLIQYGEEQSDVLLTLAAEEPLGQWRQETLDLSAYAGLDVGVTFLVHTDEAVPSTFRVDDVSLEACGAGPAARRLYLPIVVRGLPGG